MYEDQHTTNVVALKEAAFARRPEPVRPLLVVIDIQREYIEHGRPLCLEEIEKCLYRCARVLRHAREHEWDIAHVMWRQKGQLFNESQLFSELIQGFHPHGSERVFVKSAASAYSNGEFAAMMDMRGGEDTFMIGFQGPCGCLATLVDGYSRGHRLSFVADASSTQRTPDADEAAAHRQLVDIARQYACVTTTDDVTALVGAIMDSSAGASQFYADRGLRW
jgi:nicotinamidase-related amidase